MIKNSVLTPLRYPGGKSKFSPFIANVIIDNNLLGGHYLEPYAGGAGVALNLVMNDLVSHIHINDADPAIYDFWQSVTKMPEQLIRKIYDTPINMDQWFYWRSVLKTEVQVDQIDRGFATLFMNRTNRSGILKGGVIGGKAQAGDYKLDARLNKQSLISKIEKIACFSDKISVYNEDALSLLKRSGQFLPQNTLIYLDPPYYVKGQGLYRNFYSHHDHQEIATYLLSISKTTNWIVSYDNCVEICDMYNQVRAINYLLNYSAQKKYKGSEVILFSDTLQLTNELRQMLSA